MDIKNLSEFAEFCQIRESRPEFLDAIGFAGKLANMAEAMQQQYGRRPGDMPGFIDDAWRNLTIGREDNHVSEKTMQTVQETLSRFWKHGEAFDEWFRTRVVVLAQNPS